jgi:actin-related protein
MADSDKTYSESEHIAILADRVSTETASLTAERDQLATEKSDLQTQLDVAESAKTAAELRAEKAEKDLEDFKAEIQEREAAAVRKDERLTKVRESAKHLGEDFFKDEDRVNRIVAMKDEEFAGYLGDIAATSTGAPASVEAPRETAMQGDDGDKGSTSAARSHLLGRYVLTEK